MFQNEKVPAAGGPNPGPKSIVDSFSYKFPRLSSEISVFKRVEDATPVQEITWQQALENISSGKFQAQIERLRKLDKARYKREKKKLPGITFPGTFQHRKREGLKKATGFIVADLDHMEDVEKVFRLLARDENIWFAFRSPSGEGIKAGLRAEGIKADSDIKRFYQAIERYFNEVYGLEIDRACKDISRLTFVSHDPEQFINPEPCFFDIEAWTKQQKEEHAYNPPPAKGKGKEKYARKVLEASCRAIKESKRGNMHYTRLRMARLAGGYIHYLSEEEVYQALEAAVRGSKTTDLENSLKTIRDGLKYGQKAPVEIPNLPDRKDERYKKDRGKEDSLSVPTGISAADLLDKEFQEPKWAVEGILPEGLNLLAGKPKQGKSIIVLNTALSIAMGGKALESIDVEQGSVLYLALEDTQRRLQNRLKKMLTYCEDKPYDLQLHTQWPRMGEGGLTALEGAIQQTKNLRLVIIDTYALFRPANKGNNNNLYSEDYENINRIKRLADKYELSILLVHHMRKMSSEDVFEMFSGTLGLTGAADGLLAMTKTQGNTTLHITGRDVEPTELALDFDTQLMSWRVLGNAADIQNSQEKQLLYDSLKNACEPMSPKEISEATGLKYKYVRNKLPALVKDGFVKKTGYGKYEFIEGTGDSEDTEGTEGSEGSPQKTESALTSADTEGTFINSKSGKLNRSVAGAFTALITPDACKAYIANTGDYKYTPVFLGRMGKD